MQIKIREGKVEDLTHVLGLIKELADYEKASHEVTASLKELEENWTGDVPLFKFIVAVNENSIVGMALYYFGYSTWKGKMLYLDDLIVTQKLRNNGIGQLLFDELVNIAKSEGAKQMRWHVLDWNTPAIEFYKKYETNFDEEWITCKLNELQIKGSSH